MPWGRWAGGGDQSRGRETWVIQGRDEASLGQLGAVGEGSGRIHSVEVGYRGLGVDER